MFNSPIMSRIMSIDPGSTHLGIAITDVDQSNGLMFLRYVSTFNIETIVKYRFSNHEFVFGTNSAKLHAIAELVTNMAEKWDVHDVVSEAPYMGRFPRAFEVLTQCMCFIRMGLASYYGDKPLITFDPATVKKAVGVKGTSNDKTAVAMALTKLPKLNLGLFNVRDLDEHSTDSIAVGYTYISKLFGG